MQLLSRLCASAMTAASIVALTAPTLANDPASFRAGDLYLYNVGLFGLSTGNAGIMRIDAVGGTGQVILGPFGAVTTPAQQLAYDPFRNRLILASNLDGLGDLHTVDADGTTQSMGLAGNAFQLVTPTGDGRIYLRRKGVLPLSGIQYVDAAGVLNELMDVTGTAPFEVVPGQSDLAGAMIYEPATNALFIATHANWAACSGGTSTDVNFHRIPLTPDGSQVAGPVVCGQFDVDVGGFNEDPVAFAHAPDGKLLLVVDTNTNLQQCRMVLIDPVTVTGTAFACNGGYFAAATNAATYAPTRGEAVVLDTFDNVLRSYAQGEAGPGTVLGVTGVSPGGTGEDATLVAIAPIPGAFGMTASVTTRSLTAGGSQSLQIDAGVANAGSIYLVLGSATGWCPGIVITGTPVALEVDAYTNFTLVHPNSGVLSGSLGLLDGLGRGAASFNLPANSDPSLAGIVLYHVALTFDSITLFPDWASNPVAVELVP